MSTLLAIDGLSRRFGGLTAVDGVSFGVDRGEMVGLLGPNGSGKTTLINLVSGALRPNGGTIRIDGAFVGGLRPDRVARAGVARTFQLVRVFGGLTVGENVLAALAFRRRPVVGREAARQADELLATVGLAGAAERQAGDLTYIDQKRLELARALAADPAILLLDEWLAGLNPSELEDGIELIRSIHRGGVTIVMVEHVIAAIRALCPRAVVMAAGRKIADGPTEAVLSDPAVVEAYLGGDDA